MTLRNWCMAGVLSLCAAFISGCAGSAANYQPSNDNIQALGAASGKKLATGAISYGPKGQSLNNLSIRGGAYESPVQKSWAAYIGDALKTELTAAGRWDAKSDLKVSGVLLENELAGSGTAHISARFTVTRGEEKLYDRVISADNKWESSFIGAIAIPAARQNYIATISLLLGKLFNDQDFRKATR